MFTDLDPRVDCFTTDTMPTTLYKSLIYSKNNIGPTMEPYGMPHLTVIYI